MPIRVSRGALEAPISLAAMRNLRMTAAADPRVRARVNPVANVKIRSNLLAITLIITTLPARVKVSKAVVEQICYVIGQYLGVGTERPEVSAM